MSTERETMPIIAPTATMASAAFCSTSATRLATVAKRGLMTAKTTASTSVASADRASASRAPRAGHAGELVAEGLAGRRRRRLAALDQPAGEHRREQQEAGGRRLPGARARRGWSCS